MDYKRTIITAIAACLLAMSSIGAAASYGAEKNEYLKAVTYFGDEWPINYWNSEDNAMESNLEKIAEDGFNSIILVVPWREFQPNTISETYNEHAFKRLDEVMDCADRHGLLVVLRLGYSWDYYGSYELPKRFANVIAKNSSDRHAWLEYSKKIYERASAHKNFHSGFITWEDFWAYTYNLNPDTPLNNRRLMAQKSGYTGYLIEHYTLQEVGKQYEKQFNSFGEVYLPNRNHPSAKLFYDFYDGFLMELLKDTQKVFPELSLEVRADGDPIYSADGEYTYYSHKATYPCDGAPYSALMYSVSMGQANNNNRISAKEALDTMRDNMSYLYQLSGKPYFVEQLLYMDSTEAYSYNTQIEESQVGEFVRSLKPVLSETTSGYGLWVYRNYVNNCIYNSQFALGKEGWEFSGAASVTEKNGSSMALLPAGGSISQSFKGRLPSSKKIKIEFYAESDFAGASVTVKIGDTEKTFRISEAGTYAAEIPWTDTQKLVFTAGKRVYLDNIRVYTYVQNGRIYEKDGTEADLADDFRILNEELQADIRNPLRYLLITE